MRQEEQNFPNFHISAALPAWEGHSPGYRVFKPVTSDFLFGTSQSYEFPCVH